MQSSSPTSNSLEVPPQADFAEISVFGPGIGECIVLHYGQSQWAIIDSCIDPESKRPIALNYLERIGVDYKSDVKVVLVTHWHDDHIKGISRIVEECENATFFLSAALTKSQFHTLVNLYCPQSATSDMQISGIKEMRDVIRLLKSRGTPNRVKIALQDKVIVRDTIFALSPSDADVIASLAKMEDLLARAQQQRGAIPRPHENENAVAIHVSLFDRSALLGSDLETRTDPSSGWRGVLQAQTRPNSPRATLFKVPHHGSITGHLNDIWVQLLDNPISFITEFSRSRLPSDADKQRITSLSSSTFITTQPQQRAPRRDNTVEKLFNSTVKSRVTRGGPIGHIRARWNSGSNVTIETFGPATRI